MTTANKFLEQPARGSNVGIWDTPVNSNTGIIDNSFGGVANIALGGGSVTLSSGQYQCVFIRLTGALLASVTVTFPSVGSFYTIINETANSSAFTVTLQTTTGGGQVIGCPPGETCDILTDGTNVKYRDLGRIGTYWDYAGSSVPAWVSLCTIPPYLNCNGTTFSSATYPTLTVILGGTTLPDSMGRYRATLNQGSARITSGSSTGGIDGNTRFTSGGSQVVTLSSQNMPPVPITDPGHTHPYIRSDAAGQSQGAPGVPSALSQSSATTASAFTGITAGNASPTNFSNLPPTYIGGITMIRAG